MMNPTLAEARRKEQELHERYCETVRTVILRDHADDAAELMEALGLTEYKQGRGPTKAMRPPPDVDYMRRLREAGYTTPEIGRKVGLHPSTVSEHLNGRRRK